MEMEWTSMCTGLSQPFCADLGNLTFNPNPSEGERPYLLERMVEELLISVQCHSWEQVQLITLVEARGLSDVWSQFLHSWTGPAATITPRDTLSQKKTRKTGKVCYSFTLELNSKTKTVDNFFPNKLCIFFFALS